VHQRANLIDIKCSGVMLFGCRFLVWRLLSSCFAVYDQRSITMSEHYGVYVVAH